MRKHWPLWVLLMAFFGLSILSWIYPLKSFSETENRYLAKKPEWSYRALLSGKYAEDYEAYVSDQFPFRNQWMRLKSVAEAVQLRKENNDIVFGKDGHLFNKYIVLGDYFEKNLDLIKAFAQKSDQAVSFMLVPNGYEVLSNQVPKGLYNVNQGKWIDFVSQDLGDDFIDPRPFLKGDSLLYYRLDHHWTTYGAYRGYLALANEKGFEPVAWELIEKTIVPDFYGTFFSSAKRFKGSPDVIEVPKILGAEFFIDGEKMPSMYAMDYASSRDKYGLFLHNNPGRSTIKGLNPSGEKLLVFKDSYANSLLPFLSMHYETIEIIDLRYFRGSVSEIMEEPWDEVLFLFNFISFSQDRHLSKLNH